MISDAQIARLKIRDMWNAANGKGAPWGQQVVVAGNPVDLGAFYEYVVAADPEHGLENVDIDIKRNHGGDQALQRTIDADNTVLFFLAQLAKDVQAIKTHLGI